jgi:hypothetical protein
MCEWDAGELLSSWREKSRARLDDVGASTAIRSEDEGAKAILDVAGPVVRASFTAWSTGMLEMTMAGGDQPLPDVFTEQCHGWSTAEAILDRWLLRLVAVAGATSGARL